MVPDLRQSVREYSTEKTGNWEHSKTAYLDDSIVRVFTTCQAIVHGEIRQDTQEATGAVPVVGMDVGVTVQVKAVEVSTAVGSEC